MNLKKLNIKWQIIGLAVLLSILPTVIIMCLGVYYTEKALLNERINSYGQRAVLNASSLEQAFKNSKVLAMRQANLLRDKIAMETASINNLNQQSMEITNEDTKETKTANLPGMLINDMPALNNFEPVDITVAINGGSAAIFQALPEGLLQISTTLKNDNGEREVGTYIPARSPIYKAIMRGEIYNDQALIAGKMETAAYLPVKDPSGQVIGAIFGGVPQKDSVGLFMDQMAGVVIGKTGYIYILNEKGVYVLSKNHSRDEENINQSKDANERFFIQDIVRTAVNLKDPKNDYGVVYYNWRNPDENVDRAKFAAIAYVPSAKWIVAVSGYNDEETTSLAFIRWIMMLGFAVSLIAAIIFAFFVSRRVTSKL